MLICVEVISRLQFWEFDPETDFSRVLRQAVNENTIADTALMIALDMSQPWTLLDSLKKWLEVAKAHVEALNLPEDQFAAMQKRGRLHWQK